MSLHMRVLRSVAAVFAFGAAFANAGGPIGLCNGQPLKYPGAGTVNLNYDLGGLGSRTKAQADSIITQAVSLWTDVGTASVTLGRLSNSDLPVDVVGPIRDSLGNITRPANYATYIGSGTYQDGLNPVIYDSDGTIIDDLLGAGQKSHILGFAGSAYFLAPTCTYAEGRAIINGFLAISDATLITTIAHEIGHLIGLDHTQLDNTQGLAGANYPLMYPIANRTAPGLHEDDIAAVSTLYPTATINSVYGQVSGNFTVAGGATAVRGANLWAREVNTQKLYSIVSDYLMQGTGFFKLLLPAGTYTLQAEAIQSNFTSGSSVGPYSENSSDVSFQAPLYSGGVAMTAVTLGNASPIQFTITAGCAATAVFNLNGTGSLGGNCAGAPPAVSAARTDFNGDGSSDLLWRNSTTGQVYRMLMLGFTIGNGATAFTEPDTGWKIVSDGDFNGDGVTDLLWRHQASGQVMYMPFTSIGMPGSSAGVVTEPNLAWKIVHTPDLDGDGKADILWWNSTTGLVWAMLMNGSAITLQGGVYNEPNTAWQIVAVGDFAGSGKKNQLLWRNSTTGQVYLMTVNVSGGAFTQTGVMIYTEPNTAWKILAAADFNGDGKSDLLWRNDVTGQVYMMLMNGGSIASQGMVYTEPNLAWKIVAQGDYNGDGKADLLWRNETTGQVYMMQMNGLAIASQAMVYTEPNTAWKVLGPWEYGQP